MGFIKWIYSQYQSYRLEKQLAPKDDTQFLRNYKHCIDAGFTQEQLLSLLSLAHSK